LVFAILILCVTSFPRRNKKKQRVFDLDQAHEMQANVDKEDVSMAEAEVMKVDEAKMVSGLGNDEARRNKKGRKKNRKAKKTRVGY